MDSVERLLGYDECAEIFRRGEKIFRGVYSGWGKYYVDILRRLKGQAAEKDIIPTWEAGESEPAVGSFEQIFEHERITFITYPHEWTPTMLKEAAIFHVELYKKLERIGLVLKDWHPYNVLFDGAKPIFVDFPSVIRREDLTSVPYLQRPNDAPRLGYWSEYSVFLYEMYRRMCRPYFALPLHMMARGDFAGAKACLRKSALNARDAGRAITADEVFRDDPAAHRRYERGEWLKRLALSVPGFGSSFFSLVRRELQSLEVAPPATAYARYYEDKGEDFPWAPSASWSPKQRLVYDVLRRIRPATVVDLGANTGWYSVLAAREGAQVAAVEVDPSCAELIYDRAKVDNLKITPLVLDLDDLSQSTAGCDPEPGARAPEIGGLPPLLLAADDRLKAELVLMLAVMHHLVLGRDWSFDRLTSLLAKLTTRCLVVEFVSIDDDKVVDEPTFFPAYNRDSTKFGWYTLDAFTDGLKKHFSSVEIVEITSTRHALVCEK